MDLQTPLDTVAAWLPPLTELQGSADEEFGHALTSNQSPSQFDDEALVALRE